jgi:hypothetical protein
MKAPKCVVTTASGSVYTLAYGDPEAQDGRGVTLRRHNPAAGYTHRDGSESEASVNELMLDRVEFGCAPIVGKQMEIFGTLKGKTRVVDTSVVTDYEEDGEFFL